MIINTLWDPSVASAPAGFQTNVASVVSFFQGRFTDDITFNLHVGYGDVHGVALNPGNLGQSEFYAHKYSYADYKTALQSHATTDDDSTAVASLPSTSPFPSGSDFWVMDPLAAALGLLSSDVAIDMYVGFSSTLPFDYNRADGISSGQYDFIGSVAHELTEVMGRVLGAGETVLGGDTTLDYLPLDLFHWTTPGGGIFLRDFDRGGYFSLDGGFTPLAYFNPSSSGDSGDWGGSTTNDAYLAFSNPGVYNNITPWDLRVMDVLGFHGYPDDYGEDVNFAWQVSVGGSVTGSIELQGDADWFRVPLTAGVNYAIKVNGLDSGGGTLADPFLAVRDSSSKLLAQDNDSGRGHDAHLTFTPPSTGYYYIAASSPFAAGTGTYTVGVTIAPKVFTGDRLPVDQVSAIALEHLPTFLGGTHDVAQNGLVISPPGLVDTHVSHHDDGWLLS
jgi:hypothetical protein